MPRIEKEKVTHSTLRLLIVFEDMEIAESLRQFFIGEGYYAETCPNSSEMLERDLDDTALILIDITNTDPAHANAIQIIRQSYPDNMPLILVATDKPITDYIVLCMTAGAQDYILWPYSRRDLLNRVKALTASL